MSLYETVELYIEDRQILLNQLHTQLQTNISFQLSF